MTTTQLVTMLIRLKWMVIINHFGLFSGYLWHLHFNQTMDAHDITILVNNNDEMKIEGYEID